MINNILVTGMPRSGTSLMMRVCGEFGYNILGHKNVRHAPIESNLEGYMELDEEEYIPAMSTLRKTTGNVVKIFGLFIHMVPPSAIQKVIFCTRDVKQAVLSEQRMLIVQGDILHLFGKDHFLEHTRDEAEVAVRNSMFNSQKWLAFHNKNYITMKLEDTKADPKEQIERLVAYLGEGENIERAITKVNR